MRLLLFLSMLMQLAVPVLIVLLIFRSRENSSFWMTGLFETLLDENITARARTEFAGMPDKVEGVIYTRGDVVFYKERVENAERQAMIRFKARSLSFFYSDEKLTDIVFDRGGSIDVGAKEQNAGKHLLGIVSREIQLAKPMRR